MKIAGRVQDVLRLLENMSDRLADYCSEFVIALEGKVSQEANPVGMFEVTRQIIPKSEIAVEGSISDAIAALKAFEPDRDVTVTVTLRSSSPNANPQGCDCYNNARR